MSDILTIILACLMIGCGLLITMRYGLLWLQCRYIQLQEPHYILLSIGEIPEPIEFFFQPLDQELADLGFQNCGNLKTLPLEHSDLQQPWERLYHHAETGTYAKANLKAVLETHHCFEVEFYSYFTDASWLVTVNGKAHAYLRALPNSRLQDIYTASYTQQWHHHCQKLETLIQTRSTLTLDPQSFLQQLTQLGANYLRTLREEGFASSSWGIYSLTQGGQQKAVTQYLQAERKLKAIAAARKRWVQQGKLNAIPLPVELEIDSFQTMEQLQARLSRGWKMPWVIGGSLGLFLASFAHQFDFDWVSLFGFTGALILHEVGHLLAMRCFGYKNTSMLFLPFLGAVATAQKEDASLVQKVAVLLAGPLPGLLLGVILLAIAPQTSWISHMAWMLIGLNGFNLLPIYPLDGGQIAHLLVFSGYPYGDICFRLIATVGLSVLALQAPILWVMVLVVARSIPTGFRITKLTIGLQAAWRQHEPLERDARLQSVFTEMQSQGLSKLPLAQRYILAKAVMERQREIKASWKQRMTLTLVYLITLMGGLWGVLQTVMPLGIDSRATALEDSALTFEQRAAQRLALQQRSIQAPPQLGR